MVSGPPSSELPGMPVKITFFLRAPAPQTATHTCWPTISLLTPLSRTPCSEWLNKENSLPFYVLTNKWAWDLVIFWKVPPASHIQHIQHRQCQLITSRSENSRRVCTCPLSFVDFAEYPSTQRVMSCPPFMTPYSTNQSFPKRIPQNCSLRGARVYQKINFGWETKNPIPLLGIWTY